MDYQPNNVRLLNPTQGLVPNIEITGIEPSEIDGTERTAWLSQSKEPTMYSQDSSKSKTPIQSLVPNIEATSIEPSEIDGTERTAWLSQSKAPTMYSQDSSKSKTPPQKVLLFTYLFGSEAANQPFLRVFVESAAGCGVDVVIVGDTAPPFSLPSNVRHIKISWRAFARRISDALFDGVVPKGLSKAPFYKIIDFKPLFAYLFPEVVDGYDWWGESLWCVFVSLRP
jgi:hypothetical protein